MSGKRIKHNSMSQEFSCWKDPSPTRALELVRQKRRLKKQTLYPQPLTSDALVRFPASVCVGTRNAGVRDRPSCPPDLPPQG